MKILHISSAILWRGGERQLTYLLEGLLDKNISAQLVCPEHSVLSEYCKKNKLPYKTLPRASGISLKWAIRVARLIKEEKFDIIHAHDSKSHTVCVLSNILCGMKVPVIIHRKVLFPVGKNLFSRYKYRHPCVKGFICVSVAVENVVKAVAPRKKFFVINDCIDIHKYDHFESAFYLESHFPKTASHYKIGYIAALTKEKDHITFIKAAGEIHASHPDTSFFIIGDGPLKNELTEMVGKMKLQDSVIFTGFIHPVDPVIKELDLLLFTSVSEGYPSAILECFLARVPVLASNAGGIKEIVEEGVTGFSCEMKDTDCFVKKANRILGKEVDTLKIVEAAYQKVVSNNNISVTADKVITVYKKYLK